jgi:hypothetical protein
VKVRLATGAMYCASAALSGRPELWAIREGRAARYMCAPSTNFGKPPREIYVIALRLAKEEWRRRHPKQSTP